MPVETFNYLDSLNASNPGTSDGLVGGDDHIRGIKATLKSTFPSVNAAASRAIGASFGWLVGDGTSVAPSYSFASEPALGFYRAASGKMGIAGRLSGNGAVAVGSTHMFLVEPAGLGKAGTGTGHSYLELDGSTWPNSAFPDLATHLGQGGTTFTLPDAKTLGRFPRSRTASVAAGTAQANQNKAHTHTGSGTTSAVSNDHTHAFSGTTSSMNRNASHSHPYMAVRNAGGPGIGGGGAFGPDISNNTSATDTNHEHTFSGNTGGASANHTHTYSFTTSGGSADGTEARPEALSFVFCIKT